MTQVSKHKLNQQVYNKIFSLFPQFLGRLSRKGQESMVIDVLFSRVEQTMIAKRIAISFMLIKGYTYDQISSKLKVSYGTIGKIAEMTKKADVQFTDELQKISKEDAFFDFLNAIGYKLTVMLPPKSGNWSTWRRDIEKNKTEGEQAF